MGVFYNGLLTGAVHIRALDLPLAHRAPAAVEELLAIPRPGWMEQRLSGHAVGQDLASIHAVGVHEEDAGAAGRLQAFSRLVQAEGEMRAIR